jgi:hypothetical protein
VKIAVRVVAGECLGSSRPLLITKRETRNENETGNSMKRKNM